MANFKFLTVIIILSVGLANAQIPSSLTVQFMNGVITANQQSGATAAAQLANAISTACASGVKAVDARNFGTGTQSVTSTITLGCSSNVSLRIIFDPTTVWTPSGTSVNMFSILPGAEVDDLSANVTGMSGYSGNVISLSGSSLYFNITPRTYIHNLQIIGQVLSGCCTISLSNVTGTAISLTAVSSGTFIGWVDFDKVSITGMLYGVYASATNGSWINSNAFKDLRVTGAVHGVYLTTDSTSDVASNDFDRYEDEYAATYSTDAINISGTNCSANKFPSTSIWDYPSANTSITIGANCHGNYI